MELDDFKILEVRDMLKCMEKYRLKFNEDYNMLTEFVDRISRECVLNQHFFSFFDVADLVVKMVPPKAEYPKLIGLLNEAKKEYLKDKTEVLNQENKDRRDDIEVKITDEDLIPLELLRQTLVKIKNKFNEGCGFVNKYIHECQSTMDKKIRKLQVEN